jgi:hypothetical protein
LATHVENLRNRGKQRNNTSGYKGVTLYRKRWLVQIWYGGKKINLGSFRDPVEAAKVYDQAAREYFGVFAVTNFD